MNLSMQTRRAFVTLSLMAIAMVFVLSKTSMGAAAHAQLPVSEPVRTEVVLVAKETFTSPAVVIPVHVVTPMLMTKDRSARKIVRMRCETASTI